METNFDKLLDFPCFQTFKVMGVAHEELPERVVSKLQELAPGDYAPTVKESSKGNYHSMSLSVQVTSKEHMESIYIELTKIDLVRVVL
jgi:putative lipoic acid-binding regulatory protein